MPKGQKGRKLTKVKGKSATAGKVKVEKGKGDGGNALYRLKMFVESLENYADGLKEHFNSRKGEKEFNLSNGEGGAKKGFEEGDIVLVKGFELSFNQVNACKDEYERTKLTIDIINKIINDGIQ